MRNRAVPAKGRILFLFTLLCSAIADVQIIDAATITVTNTNDNGPGSLRQALAASNDGDTINFSVTTPAMITLTSGELVVNKGVAINGPGPNGLAINGNANGRVFSIRGSLIFGSGNTISGMTILNAGGAQVENGGGIYIYERATVTLNNCFVAGNLAAYGGGIFVTNANLTLTNCAVSANVARRGGGGIFISGMTGAETTVTINNSTISGDTANNGGGGGITNDGNRSGSTTLKIINSTISANSCSQFGGGIENNGVAGSATLTINNSTISNNSALAGSGIYNADRLAMLTIGNTILRKNSPSGPPIIYNVFGRVTSLGYNLSSDNGSGLLIGPGDQISTDPMLGPLQNNGGPTFTHALLPGSPAIDHGNPAFTPPPDDDQRDCPYKRVFNGRIDVGSFESQPPPPPCPTPRPRPTPAPR